jgi:hypothetical protein
MKDYPVFRPAHYEAAIKAGMSYQTMLNNLDKRADQLGRLFAKAIKGYVWDIDGLVEEARAVRDYQYAFMTWLLDYNTSPLREKERTREGRA